MKNQIKFKFLSAIFLAIFLIGCDKDDEQLLQQSNEQSVNLEVARTSLLTEKEVKSNSLFSQLVQQTELNRFVDLSTSEYKSNGAPFVILANEGQLIQNDHLSSIKLSLYTEKESMYDIDNLVLVDHHGEKKIFWYTYHYTQETYNEFANNDNYKFELKHTKRELNLAGEVINTEQGESTVSSIANNNNSAKAYTCRDMVIQYAIPCTCADPPHYPYDWCVCSPRARWQDKVVRVCGNFDETNPEQGPLAEGWNDGYFNATGYGNPNPIHSARRPIESDSGGGGLGDDGGFGSTPFISNSEVQTIALSNIAGLTFSQQNFYLDPSNQRYVPALIALKYDSEYSSESKIATRVFTEALRTNSFITRQFNQTFFQRINQEYSANTLDPAWQARYVTQIYVTKALNPGMSWLEAAWIVSREAVHWTLDVAGLVPVIGEAADLLNGGLYLLEDKNEEAALSFAGAVPFAGWAATGTKFAVKIGITATGKTGVKVVAAGTQQIASLAAKASKFAGEVNTAINTIKNGAKVVLDGTGTFRKVGGHHPMAKKAFEGVSTYDLKEAFSVSLAKLRELGVSHAVITGKQNSLYSAWKRANPTKRMTAKEMAEIEVKAMVQAGVPEDIAKGWVLKALEDLKAQGVTEIINIPWNGLNPL